MIGGYEDLGCGCTDEDLGGDSRDVDDKMIAVEEDEVEEDCDDAIVVAVVVPGAFVVEVIAVEEDEVEEDCDAAIVVVVEASVAADIPSSGWMLPRAQG